MYFYYVYIRQYFGFSYFRLALHITIQTKVTESTVQYFIVFRHFFLTEHNLILAWEGAQGWPAQNFPQDKNLSHDMQTEVH